MAGNLTRINNNQITDAISGNVYFGINANTKVQPYSITSTLLANNLTYGSDLTISGNLSVTGNVTAIDTTNVTIEDPLILLASNQSGSPTVDIGYIGQRGTSNNIAFVWDESSSSFVTVFTDSGTIGNTNINILSYANLITGSANVTGDLIAGNVSLNGNVTSNLNVTANIAAGNITTDGIVSATGNVSGNYFIGNGSQLTGVAATTATALVNGTSSANIATANGNMTVTIANTLVSTFYDNGVNFTGDVSVTGNAVAGNVTVINAFNGNTISLSGNVTSDLNVTGDVTANNVTVINALNGNTVSLSGNVTSDLNVTENISANNVTITNAINGNSISLSGNVTSDLNVSGNVTANNVIAIADVSASGNVVANAALNGNTLSLSGNVTSDLNVTSNLIANYIGSTSTISALGNVYAANYVTTGSGGNISGVDVLFASTVTATGNVYAEYFVTPDTTVNGGVFTTGDISAAGDIESGGYFLGDGGLLSNINGANVSSTKISNGNSYANIASANANLVVAIGDNSNVVATFYDQGISFTGNVEASSSISAVGNITGNYILGNGSQLTGIITTVSNVINGNSNLNIATANANITLSVSTVGNVAVFSPVGVSVLGTVAANGNVSGGNVSTAGLVTATGNITGGNVSTAGLVTATGNITGGNVSTAGLVTATGNITGGNVVTAGLISATGNVLTSGLVTATGNVTGGNLLTGGLISATGNITTSGIVNTANITGVSGVTITTGGNTNINFYPGGTGNLVLPSGNSTYINNLALNPVQDGDAATKYYVDTMVSTGLAFHAAVYVSTTTDLATTTGGTITYNQPNGAGNGIGATITTTGSFNFIDTANVQTANTRILVKDEGNAVLNGVYLWSNATVITRSTDADEYGPNSDIQLSLNDYFFTTNGNVNAGSAFVVNEPTGNIIFGTSNISFALFSSSQTYISGNGINIAGTVINAKVDEDTTAFDGGGNIIVKASANLVTPNIGAATGTSLSTTGTVTSGNVLTGGVVSATGDVTGGNILTAGFISATGNITADTSSFFIGNGSQLTGISSTAGTALTNGDTNISTALNGNANITINGTSNVVVVTTAGVDVIGNVSATGDIIGGNITTAGFVSATGNVYSGNLINAGSSSVTGNLTAGNILTAGLISSTSNVISGNVLTGGIVSATGNIYAANFITGNGAGGNITGADLITANTISATANIIGGNVLTAGVISTSGNIYGNGRNISDTYVTSPSTDTGGDLNILLSSNISFTGAVVGTGTSGSPATINPGTGFIKVSGASLGGYGLSVNGGITAYNGGGFIGDISAGGNVSAAGNILTTGFISATGNITADTTSFFIGNGSQLTGISTTAGTALTNGNTNITTELNGNANVTIGGTNNVVVWTTTGEYVTGEISATGNITGNYILGNGSQLTGIITSVSNVINGSSNLDIATANADVTISVSTVGNVAVFSPTGVSLAGNVSASGNVVGGNLATVGSVTATGDVVGGNVLTGGYVSAAGNVYSDNISLSGNVYGTASDFEQPNFIQPAADDANWSYGVTTSPSGVWMQTQFNGGQSTHGVRIYDNFANTYPFVVDGDGNVNAATRVVTPSLTSSSSLLNIGTTGGTSVAINGGSANLLFVNGSTNTVAIGSNVITTGATLAINATDSFLLPVGNTAQRPGTTATGMMRYNTTLSKCEVWDGATWTSVGGSSFTVIANEQFSGDGSTVAFTLGSSQTTVSCIVTINGVVQAPTTAYSVSGVYPNCVLTFTEAPVVGDTIDVREITTTTTVTYITNTSGNSAVSVQENTGEVDITGNLVAELNAVAPSLTANSTMSFRLVNNTTLAILVRGTDGVTRTANITLS